MSTIIEKLIEQFPALAGFLVLCYFFISAIKWILKSHEAERTAARAEEIARWKSLHSEHMIERLQCREVTAAHTIAVTAKMVQEEKTIAAMNNLSHVITEKFKTVSQGPPS